MKQKKELGVFEKIWTVFKTRRRSLVIKFTHIEDLYGARGGNFNVEIRKIERSIYERICFWFLRLKFKNLTIEELKKLSSVEIKTYLHEKYYLYGIVPYLKNDSTSRRELTYKEVLKAKRRQSDRK